MVWLEIINVRTAGTVETAKALELCREACQSVTAGQPVRALVFRSALYDTDFSIHLQWETDPGPGGKSVLGRQVSSALSDFGLINHTLWTGQENVASDGQSVGKRKPLTDTRRSSIGNEL